MNLLNYDLTEVTKWLTTTGLKIFIVVIVSFVLYRLLIIATRQLVLRLDQLDDEVDSHQDRRAATISSLVKNSGVVVIVTVAVLMILDQLGINIAPILASVGVVSLAIGLGAQTLVKDVISGLFIILEDQFHIGDVIEVEDSLGTVEEMTLRLTKIRDVNGYVYFVPNGEIRLLANRSRDWSRAIVDVGIPYEADVEQALDVLQEIGDSAINNSEVGPLILDQPQVTGIEGLDDWQVRLRILVKTQSGEHFGVQRYLRARIREEFPAHGIMLASPRQEVVLLQNSVV